MIFQFYSLKKYQKGRTILCSSIFLMENKEQTLAHEEVNSEKMLYLHCFSNPHLSGRSSEIIFFCFCCSVSLFIHLTNFSLAQCYEATNGKKSQPDFVGKIFFLQKFCQNGPKQVQKPPPFVFFSNSVHWNFLIIHKQVEDHQLITHRL